MDHDELRREIKAVLLRYIEITGPCDESERAALADTLMEAITDDLMAVLT